METWKESQLKQLTFARNIDSAFAVLLRFIENLGFNFCSIVITPCDGGPPFKPLRIDNYPKGWNLEYEQEGHVETDPITSHCQQSMLPLVWSEAVFANAPSLWQLLQQYGIHHGWSQSFNHEENGFSSIVSLSRRHCPISPFELYEHFGYMFYVTNHLSDLFARSLPRRPGKSEYPRLTARELEVLQLSALGKTAYEIARILSISERTVGYYIQKTLQKLNVCNKISAVMRAAKIGII
ncbi:autoinducer binding domain-containing protein [Pseudomonas baetica]|uniref:autoinducer binding domain-containing protein n=1 Tax=Pseudomonas baetica TaxID=674054 RepID=UPI0028727764|nr:autoinducer binding domain-containing protein [Pseudomonas baetica]MDR9862072.1 autoinducer binding domain-containing protein [Pseudomonas baetica]